MAETGTDLDGTESFLWKKAVSQSDATKIIFLHVTKDMKKEVTIKLKNLWKTSKFF